MTFRPIRLSLLAATALLVTAPPTFAQSTPTSSSVPDRGKRRILSLFGDAVAAVNDSVVRVLSDGKEVALGTVVTEDGKVLTKGSDLKGELQCVLRDGTKHKAFHVGYHKPSDLALIKMDAEGLKPLKFLGEDPAALGNWVAAVGVNSDALAVGVVSVKTRKLSGDQAFVENSNRGILGIQMKTDSTDGVDSADSRVLIVPATFVEKVSAGWRYDSRTRGWAARWITTAGATSDTAFWRASDSRMSTRWSVARSVAISARSKSEPGSGSSASPWTRAPSRWSQSESHAPLKPVCPVTSTSRSARCSSVTMRHPFVARLRTGSIRSRRRLLPGSRTSATRGRRRQCRRGVRRVSRGGGVGGARRPRRKRSWSR